MIKKLSAVISVAAMLIFGTAHTYGQDGTGRVSTRVSSSADTIKQDNTDKTQKAADDEMRSAKDFYRQRGGEDISSNGFLCHEFLTWIGGGYSSLNYAPTFGTNNYRFGGILGLGYGFHFSPHWSLGLGAEISLYNARTNVDDLTDSYTINDQDGDQIRYYSEIEHYTEKQRLYALNIPVWLQYQTPVNKNGNEFYAALGLKIGVPFSARYRSTEASFNAFGYYEELNQTLYDQRDLGYGENTGKKLDEKLDLNLSYMGSAEAGIKWKTSSSRMNIYTGIYLDYGFNDLMKAHSKRFLDYSHEEPENLKNNSVLTSSYTHLEETNHFADKVSNIAFGLKVRIGFSTCKERKRAKVSEEDLYEDYIRDEKGQNDLNEAYQKGYRDAYKDLHKEDFTPRRNSPLDEHEKVYRDEKSYYNYTSDSILEIERKRIGAEYPRLEDLLVLNISGYELNQTKLSPVMERMIDEKIRLLKKYNNDKYTIICEGHTCNLGSESLNMNLGWIRADAVREYLMKKGFNGDNIVPISRGQNLPALPNTSESNRKINRRVVFLIIEVK